MNGFREVQMSEDALNVSLTTLTEKKCSRCKIVKSVDEFLKNSRATTGLRSECKTCKNAANRIWSHKNYVKIKETYNAKMAIDPESIRTIRRRWRMKNPDKALAASNLWRKHNRDRVNAQARLRYAANPDKFRTKSNKWAAINQKKIKEYKAIIRSTLSGKINHRMSTAIYISLLHSKNGHSWESLVGYTLDNLKFHLESKFKPGMSWNNMGKWHIDHIIPVSVFNFSCPDDIDFKRCWALSNLQPLWAKENISKSAKLSKPFQPCFSFGIEKQH